MAPANAIVFSADPPSLPDGVRAWLSAGELSVVHSALGDEVIAVVQRSRPRVVLVDGRRGFAAEARRVVRRLKADPLSSIIPVIMVLDAAGPEVVQALEAGADEVLAPGCPSLEAFARLEAAIRRSDRDVRVHPSTRMPGAAEIDAEIGRRMAARTPFAACYADLDYFKEFNDRYSYHRGDRIIQITSLILRDVVKGLCDIGGFVGHIGGDDFIFIIPIEPVGQVCSEIISVFDTLIPLQYSDEDRVAGYFFGKDRRGQLHRVPLMTISIGVVTTERRSFTHAAQVSALATEMKSYAKTLPGSVYTIDRRQDEPSEDGHRPSTWQFKPATRDGGTT